MIVRRRLCRNRNTTSTTSSTASKNVRTTSSIEAWTNLVVSSAMSYLNPSGKPFAISASVARTFFDTSIALAPGCW